MSQSLAKWAWKPKGKLWNPMGKANCACRGPISSPMLRPTGGRWLLLHLYQARLITRRSKNDLASKVRGGCKVFSARFRPISDLLSGWASKLRKWQLVGPAEPSARACLTQQHADSAHSLNIYSSKNIVAYLNIPQHWTAKNGSQNGSLSLSFLVFAFVNLAWLDGFDDTVLIDCGTYVQNH